MKRFVILALLACGASAQDLSSRLSGLKLEKDERQLWRRVEEECSTLDHSGFVAPWPEAEAYVNQVLNRLHPEPLPSGAKLHVQILVDPTLNAFALPNGAIYIHTGMLARLENEAQLAAVLSHELTHAAERHGIKTYRSVKHHTAFLATLTVGTGGIGGLLGGWGVMASVSGYSRDLEREADKEGFALLVAGGYDPREAPKVFRTLLAESKRSKIKEPFFFGSHPRLTERIDSYDQLVAALPSPRRTSGVTAPAEYAAILPRVLVANAEAASRAGDFDFARACAEHCLQLQAGDPSASFQLAEVFRKRDGQGDAALALARYRELVAAHPDFAEAQRGLGLLLMKTGDTVAASDAFARYLALRPAAADRAYIESFIQQCQRKT